jgi:DNA-binding NtrC family response regulator
LEPDRQRARRALVIGLTLIEWQALRAALKAEGFDEVYQAENAAEAAAVLASELVEAVFTPAAGPDFTFRDVIGLLHGRGPNRTAAVILVGTHMAQPDIVAAIKAGARGVLSLPAHKEALRQLLPGPSGPRPGLGAESATPRRPRAPGPRRRDGKGTP